MVPIFYIYKKLKSLITNIAAVSLHCVQVLIQNNSYNHKAAISESVLSNSKHVTDHYCSLPQ